MRLQALHNDPPAIADALEFPSYLLNVGEVKCQSNDKQSVPLSRSVTILHCVGDMILRVFPDIHRNYRNVSWIAQRTILTTQNERLQILMPIIGSRLEGDIETYESADSVEEAEIGEHNYPVDLLNAISGAASLLNNCFSLKNGFINMLVWNSQPNKYHINGTRYIVEKMTINLLFLRVVTGLYKGRPLPLPQILLYPCDDHFPITGFKRILFLFSVRFIFTTNKAHCQSFSGALRIDLRQECFTHGQLYAAISWITHIFNISIYSEHEEYDHATGNVVCRSLLLTD